MMTDNNKVPISVRKILFSAIVQLLIIQKRDSERELTKSDERESAFTS